MRKLFYLPERIRPLWCAFALFLLLPCGDVLAKETKTGKVALQAPLLQSPNAKSAVLLFLTKGESVTIRGDKGRWLKVELSKKRGGKKGWVQSHYIRSKEAARTSVKKKRKTIRLEAYGGLAWGAKDMPRQLRLGGNALYGKWKKTDAGVSGQFGFQNGTLISVGPMIVHRPVWPDLGPFILGLSAGFPLVYYKQGGTSDFMFGVKVGAELKYSIFRIHRRRFYIVARGEPEILFLGSGTVRIPVLTSLGFQGEF